MITRNTPGHPLLRLLYQLIEEGTAVAFSFFDGQPEPTFPDPYLYPAIVRWHITRGLDALDGTSVTYERTELPNNGVEVRYQGQRIKVFKSTPEGELPAPGLSLPRQAFYQPSLFGEDGESTNLVVMWEVDSSYNLNSVQLVRPSGDGTSWKTGQQEWAVRLPHPASFEAPPTIEESGDLDLQYGDEDDLDILDIEDTGTEEV